MTTGAATPDPPPENPFLALARRLAATGTDAEAAAVFQQATGLTGDPERDREIMAERVVRRTRAGTDWSCSAYGADTEQRLGRPMCFFELTLEPCGTLPECEQRMVAERARVHDRIREFAAGDGPDAPLWQSVLEGFESVDLGDQPDPPR